MNGKQHTNAQRPPDFLCIGAQKAGTTWVYSVLYHTAGIFVPPIKESNYLLEVSERDREWARQFRFFQADLKEKDYRARWLPVRKIASILDQIEHFRADEVDDQWYRTVFGYARDDQIAGEVCPSYLTLATHRTIEHALQLNPDVRALVMVRDPVDRFWSQIRMDIRYRRLTQPLDSLLHDEHGLSEYIGFSDFANSIERWSSRLKPGHLRLMLYDDIVERPRALAGEIVSFFGGDPSVALGWSERINAGRPKPMSRAQRARVLSLMQPQYAYLRKYFPRRVDAWLDAHSRALNLPRRDSA